MKTTVTVIAIGTLAAAFCMNALAGTMAEAPSEAVKFSDLNAAQVSDAAVLFNRIESAAGRVCGQRAKPGSFAVSAPWQQCVQLAVRDAVVKVNRPAVSAYATAHQVLAAEALVARRN